MKLYHKITFPIFLSISVVSAKTKIACVGDSITFGAGVANRAERCYPAQLNKLLGPDYEVRNFGLSGRTMLNKGDRPYSKEKGYKKSKDYQPDIVIIKLGTNDSKPRNWKFKAEFAQDTKTLIQSYRDLASKPRVILCKPVVVVKSAWGITEKITRGQVAKEIEQVAFDAGVELIDLHPPLLDKKQYIPDGVHPNAQGAEVMATHIHRYLTTERIKQNVVKIPQGKKSSFYGFKCSSIKVNGVNMKVVAPKIAAKGAPWIWRARFWGHQPQFDLTMLELGWHLVYADVSGLFGAPSAIERWEKAYTETQKWGLGKKPILEGMSRGGLPIHQWALKHPDKTGGIIGDNCVMDFKSWPAGFGSSKGSARDWKQCKTAFGFKTDADATSYKNNPIDHIKTIAKNSIPLLYLIGDSDNIVPHKENSGLAVDKLKDYKHLHVIIKSDLGHHPHSLPNPAPIVDFALKCNGSFIQPASSLTP